MYVIVILALVALGASTALLLYMLRARRRDKQPTITPEEKIGERRDVAPPVVEYEPLPESGPVQSVSVRPQREVPSVEVEKKPADATEANPCPPEKVESVSAGNITQPEAEPTTTELTKFPEEEFHPTIEPAAEVMVGEMEDTAEGTRSPVPAKEAERSGVDTTEADYTDLDEDSPAKEANPRQKRQPVSPENRGGRSRGTAPKNDGESTKKRRPRTPRPEIVCWKQEREWILAVELPDDFPKYQNLTVIQDGNPLDRDETEAGCWRLSQLHGEVVVRVSEAEDESIFKITLSDAGCLVFKLSGSDRNLGRRVNRPASGSCLAVVPREWKRDEALAGAPPYQPEAVCLSGYQAHFFEL